MNDRQNRETYIDILRILSVIAVIYIHTGDAGYTLYTGRTPGTPVFLTALLLNHLSGHGVPLFMMISGATLLGKSETVREVWSKRIARIVLSLLVFSVIAYIQRASQGHYDRVGIGHFFSMLVLEDGVIIPYWYLYAYLGFLITLPFLRVMARNMTKEMINYLVLMVVLWEVLLPLFSQFVLQGGSINRYLGRLWIMEQFVLLPVMGFVLTRKDTEGTIWFRKMIPAGVLVFFTGYLVRIYGYTVLGSDHPVMGQTLVCMALFLAVRRAAAARIQTAGRPGRIVSWGGRTAFGVYLIHVILMNLPPLSGLLPLFKLEWHIPSLIAAMIDTGIIYVLSALVTALLQLIPYVRKVL